jgi:hypothetical protein
MLHQEQEWINEIERANHPNRGIPSHVVLALIQIMKHFYTCRIHKETVVNEVEYYIHEEGKE